MEFYPGGLVLFSLVLELRFSSFRSTKVFRIITIKDPNLEDLFMGSTLTLTTVGF